MESAKVSSSQGTQPAHATRSRSTAQATPDANSAAPTGFLALLAALGDAVDPLNLADSTALPGGAGAADATKDAVDAAAMAAWQGLLAPGAALQGDTTALQGIQTAGLRLATQDGAATTTVGAGLGAQGGALPLSGVGGLPQGMVAETAMLDASADLKDGVSPVGGAAHGRTFSRMQSALAQRADALEGAAGRSRVGEAALLPQGHQVAVAAAVQAASERMAGGLPVAGAAERGTAGTGNVAANGAAAVESLLAAVVPARGGDAAGGGSRPGEGRSESGAWFDHGNVALGEPGAVDGGAVFGDPAQAGMEDQVAEQVAYWVNQKTQNAELTLNRDGQPVEVSVSLSGNEAHVAFRSDQPQTRELLDQSMAQLSELLRAEGLVLSGMSVGTSAGQGDGGGNAERQGQRDGARQAQVAAVAPAGTGSLMRGGSPDRAVDIFV